ncbi:MAG: hypothetical protein LBR39_04360 [Coriobacteriales bacterium]|nr:hypothetical protein [Coriobacteriales bacterium]
MFEKVCISHVEQIKAKLGISGVSTQVSAWRSKHSKPAAQIDLIISRADNIIDLCEAKYTRRPFAIDAACNQLLTDRMETFREETGTDKALHIVMISASGLTSGSYRGSVQFIIELDDLFR